MKFGRKARIGTAATLVGLAVVAGIIVLVLWKTGVLFRPSSAGKRPLTPPGEPVVPSDFTVTLSNFTLAWQPGLKTFPAEVAYDISYGADMSQVKSFTLVTLVTFNYAGGYVSHETMRYPGIYDGNTIPLQGAGGVAREPVSVEVTAWLEVVLPNGITMEGPKTWSPTIPVTGAPVRN